MGPFKLGDHPVVPALKRRSVGSPVFVVEGLTCPSRLLVSVWVEPVGVREPGFPLARVSRAMQARLVWCMSEARAGGTTGYMRPLDPMSMRKNQPW